MDADDGKKHAEHTIDHPAITGTCRPGAGRSWNRLVLIPVWLDGGGCSVTLYSHSHAMLGPQRDERLRHDLEARDWSERDPLGERGQHQLCFMQRELITNAGARPDPERQIGVAWQRCLTRWQPAIRVKARRLRE